MPAQSLIFRKSRYSSTARYCVEVADLPAGAAMRDSKHPDSGHLTFNINEWQAFLVGAQRDEL